VAKDNEINSRQPGWHIVKTCLILSDGGLKRAARKCKGFEQGVRWEADRGDQSPLNENPNPASRESRINPCQGLPRATRPSRLGAPQRASPQRTACRPCEHADVHASNAWPQRGRHRPHPNEGAASALTIGLTPCATTSPSTVLHGARGIAGSAACGCAACARLHSCSLAMLTRVLHRTHPHVCVRARLSRTVRLHTPTRQSAGSAGCQPPAANRRQRTAGCEPPAGSATSCQAPAAKRRLPSAGCGPGRARPHSSPRFEHLCVAVAALRGRWRSPLSGRWSSRHRSAGRSGRGGSMGQQAGSPTRWASMAIATSGSIAP
jgi:hypothetical protein